MNKINLSTEVHLTAINLFDLFTRKIWRLFLYFIYSCADLLENTVSYKIMYNTCIGKIELI